MTNQTDAPDKRFTTLREALEGILKVCKEEMYYVDPVENERLLPFFDIASYFGLTKIQTLILADTLGHLKEGVLLEDAALFCHRPFEVVLREATILEEDRYLEIYDRKGEKYLHLICYSSKESSGLEENGPKDREKAGKEAFDSLMYSIQLGVRDSDDFIIFGDEPPCLDELPLICNNDSVLERFLARMDKSIWDLRDVEPVFRGLETLGFLDMPKAEKFALLYAMDKFRYTYTQTFPAQYANGKSDEISCEEAIRACESLCDKGILEFFGRNYYDQAREDGYCLSPSSVRTLFHGHEEFLRKDEIQKLASVVAPGEIKEKELFYNREDTPMVELIRELCDSDKGDEVLGELQERGLKSSLSILLYGESGVGKSELARQVARSSGRYMVKLSYTKVCGAYVGETEKLTVELFRALSYMEALLSKAPILYIDEADSILCKRVDVRYSNDAFLNNTQDIYLQELERYRGILIAATNTTANIDPAFDSRILLKVEIHSPDAQTRKRILLGKLPELDEKLAREIAGEFPLTGRQIDNLSSMVLAMKVLRGRMPLREEIRGICLREAEASRRATLDSRFEEKKGGDIGFLIGLGEKQ